MEELACRSKYPALRGRAQTSGFRLTDQCIFLLRGEADLLALQSSKFLGILGLQYSRISRETSVEIFEEMAGEENLPKYPGLHMDRSSTWTVDHRQDVPSQYPMVVADYSSGTSSHGTCDGVSWQYGHHPWPLLWESLALASSPLGHLSFSGGGVSPSPFQQLKEGFFIGRLLV